MKYQVLHTTTYRYTQPVPLCHNQVHLTPRAAPWQRCLRHELSVSPQPSCVVPWIDYFGNPVQFFSVETPHRELVVTTRCEVEVLPPLVPSPEVTEDWEQTRLGLQQPASTEALAAVQFLWDSTLVQPFQEARDYAAPSFPPGRPILEAALDLTGRIYRDFRYDETATAVNTPPAEAFEQRHGVCQDFAHVQIACLRSLGLAARYVSGYLLTNPPPGKPRLVGADASHAWLSVYCGPAGWVDLDPTNNVIPDIRHITLAWGRDYSDVCPIQGVLIGGGQSTLAVSVDVSE